MSLPDLKTIQIREVLAFRLFAASDDFPILTTDGVCRDQWQGIDEEVRKDWRRQADQHIANLEKAGLGVRVSDSAKLAKHLDWLVTVPPRPAYTLPSAAPEPTTIQLPNPR